MLVSCSLKRNDLDLYLSKPASGDLLPLRPLPLSFHPVLRSRRTPQAPRLRTSRRILPAAALILTCVCSPALHAQFPSTVPAAPPPRPRHGEPTTAPPPSPPPSPSSTPPISAPTSLPDAPGESSSQTVSVVQAASTAFAQTGDPRPRLNANSTAFLLPDTHLNPYQRLAAKRARILNPYQRFLDTNLRIPMTPGDKAFMAATDVVDPGNLITATLGSAIYVATNPESAYGPGMPGFGRNLGYTLAQDTIAESIATFAIPSLVHQDPRYYRMPGAPIRRRLLHALSHTVVTYADDGSRMPNYATLITYPVTGVLSNLYVPNLQTDSRSTTARILVGLASDPVESLVGEFLPDLGKHVHIRILFFQQIVNNVSAQPSL